MQQSDIQPLLQILSSYPSVECIKPGDKAYEEARLVYNRMHDVHPLLIVRSLDIDVLRCVLEFAQEMTLPLAIRGGGHHIAGFGTCHQGVVVDFSPFKKIEIDEQRMIASIEPGALLADVDEVLSAAGFVLPTGTVSQTGLAGLTLGGGIGWLTGRLGLTCDQLCGADVLLANGELVQAEDPSHADLLWALRGGGGNFGVVLRLRYRIHPLPVTQCGTGLVAIEHVKEVGAHLLSYLQSHCPRSVTVAPIFAKDEQGSAHLRIDFCCAEADEHVIAPLLNLSPHIVWSNVGVWSFKTWQRAFDQAFLPPMRGYWKACYLERLSVETFNQLYEAFLASPSSRCSILIEHLHGAFMEYNEETAAFPLRSCQFGILFSARWETQQEDVHYKSWVKQSFQKIDPHERSKTYLNYTHEEDARAVETLLSQTALKLKHVKRRYDPHNCFRKNHNVIPQNT